MNIWVWKIRNYELSINIYYKIAMDVFFFLIYF